MSLNLTILHGNVGKEPEIKTVGEKKVAKFSLATTRRGKDKDGQKITDWHNLIVWDKLAELVEKYVHKGSEIVIEGQIQYRNYENKDGVKIYMTEIICHSLDFCGKKEAEKSDDKPQANNEWQGKKEVKAMSDVNDLPGANEESPF